jgi:predicted lactoylglutathione lyase
MYRICLSQTTLQIDVFTHAAAQIIAVGLQQQNQQKMATRIFVNLPVKDLQRSIQFFTQLGFSFNPQFTDESATCMVISEHIYAMLLTEARFSQFTKKPVADATKTTEVLIALDADNREAIDEMVRKAAAAGGTIYADPQDHGWMYAHSFADLDGHQWELVYMDESALPQEAQTAAQIA